jgi:hypothetical protein
MTNSQKTPSPIINGLIGAIVGFFIGIVAISVIVMIGIWAFIVAIVGGISISVIGRCTRIINRTRRGATIGMIIGFLISVITILVWVELRLNLSANRWAGAIFVLTMGILQIFIPDSLLASWLKTHFPRLISDNVSK